MTQPSNTTDQLDEAYERGRNDALEEAAKHVELRLQHGKAAAALIRDLKEPDE